MSITPIPARHARSWPALALLLLAACTDRHPTAALEPPAPSPALPAPAALVALDCRASIRGGDISCGLPPAGGARRAIIGEQDVNVVITGSNGSASGGVFQVDMTLTNLLPEAMGTPDGEVVDTAGISVFFASGPTVTVGTGSVAVANADGVGTFTAANQPYFRYDQKLAHNQVSAPKSWKFAYDPGVQEFQFRVYVAAELQPLLVITEMLVNPGGIITDAAGEWFELYNAGRFPVQMQGLVIADSAASGRRPYHEIATSLVVQPGGYVVFGESADTIANGGVKPDYVYATSLGTPLTFANSLDAFKIARVYGTDTLTIDRTQYSQAAVSAQNGISRELKNPALDNSNMDGSNWADAAVSAVYGPGGRGTPGARNSAWVP